jgi:hypothetical protein
MRSAYKILVEMLEGRRPPGAPRYRWEDNMKFDLQVIGCEIVNWIFVALDKVEWWALLNRVMNLQVP